MQILNTQSQNFIEEIINVLNNGGTFVYPTETCYGIGVDASNAEAVSKIFEVKGRDENKPISIAVSSIEMAKEYVEISPLAEKLFNKYTPGPITIICKSKGKVDPRVESANSTLGIRIPDHVELLQIINDFGKAITSTSANKSGDANPYTIQNVMDSVGVEKTKLIDVFWDAGHIAERLPSTVIDTTQVPPIIVRQGELKIDLDF